MKALTIWQPWASLIIAGAKPFEFRSWAPPAWLVGQRLAIHAGARKVDIKEVRALLMRLSGASAWQTGLRAEIARPILERLRSNPTALPASSIIGMVTVGAGIKSQDLVAKELGAVVNDSDRDEQANWAWPMLEIQPLTPIEPCRGAQGLWNWQGV